jgi:3-dehydroquinate synthase
LIVGGGVLADIGGFACALYHRNTPYVMLCTSIVSGIDAGPSPRTCCDGFGYKNLYGAYHPPILTLTDRSFWATLRKGWVRHGIAEIIKMAVVDSLRLFELLEKAGPKLVDTQFGTSPESLEDDEFQKLCDEIVGLAMLGYVRSEYGNLWETHQCRPHAYGHTWSPGYELPAGMLHGHAVATCMGFAAYLSCRKMEWISEAQMMRILNVISTMELALWHPIMDDHEIVYASQKKMTDKRGGNLAATVPKGTIGECGYINDVDESELSFRLDEYKALIERHFPGVRGSGVEVQCVDVGLQDPSTVIPAPVTDAKPKANVLSYQEWIATVQTQRNEEWVKNVVDAVPDTESPPEFKENSLFVNETVENYAMENTSTASAAIQNIAKVTSDEKLFSPCMVGSLEAQFLKMQISVVGAKKVLDVGTFTGMSAMAMAEGGAGEVVTIEFDEKIAKVALKNFREGGYAVAVHGMEEKQEKFEPPARTNATKMTLHVRSATEVMQELQKRSEKFDVIFLDADKENYSQYYDLCMDGPNPLLAEGGVILADNSLCALLYDAGDERRQKLHEFNQQVKNDPRVEQVILTIREGITMITRKSPA